ncbi:hypothetical protein [uncultured Caulobacter sp.]|uniref:hypothetical protein n=1 Tax=uncultured Caulobacter sp. TaxID=158749 RepID=UPI002603210D|nr:hypothetical protein [uncultured Caulobacter sp.]
MAAINALGAALLASAAQQPAAPPLVEYAPPSAATVEGSYVCAAKPVAIKVKAQEGAVKVVFYSGSAGPAPPAQLEAWNRFLERFSAMTGLEFLCQDGGYELIRINGVPRSPADRRTWLNVYWANGRLGLLP